MSETLTRTEIRMKKTKERLMEAALEVFGESGFMKAKVKDITDKADVGYGSFYRYFDNKRTLVIELIKRANEELLKKNRERVSEEHDIKSKLYTSVSDILKFYVKYKSIYFAIEEAENDRTLIMVEKELQSNLFELIKYPVQSYLDKGVFRETVDDSAIHVLFCMIDGCGKQIIKTDCPDLERYAKTMAAASYHLLFGDTFDRQSM